MKRFFPLVASLLLLTACLVNAPPAAAQAPTPTPPGSYTFGDAKAHSPHVPMAVESGQYCGRRLFNDSTNNPGNNFLGNAICIDHWLNGPTWYWYDWSADIGDSVVKLAMWESNPPSINLTYDQTCLLVTVASTESPYGAALNGVITGDAPAAVEVAEPVEPDQLYPTSFFEQHPTYKRTPALPEADPAPERPHPSAGRVGRVQLK